MRPNNFELNQQHPLARGLVFAGLGAYAGSGRYHDSSAYGKHGTRNTGITSISHQLGRRLVQVNTLQGITLPSVDLYKFTTSPFSISMLAMSLTPQWSRYILQYDSGSTAPYGIWISDSGTSGIKFRHNSNGTDEITYTHSPVGMQHITGVWDGAGNSYLYVNGQLKKTGSTSGTEISYSTFGAQRIEIPYVNWSGVVGDIVIHNRVLTHPEVRTLANLADPMLSGLIREPGDSSNVYNWEGIR